jgi:hypothetical protein
VDGADRADVGPLWSLYQHVSDPDPFPARPQGVARRVRSNALMICLAEPAPIWCSADGGLSLSGSDARLGSRRNFAAEKHFADVRPGQEYIGSVVEHDLPSRHHVDAV